MIRKSASALFVVALSLACAHGQPPSDAKASQGDIKKQLTAAAEKAAAPTAQHKALAALVGDFEQTTEMRMGPGDPIVAHAVCKGTWILGDRFVEVRSASTAAEELKGERIVIYGYDPAVKKYTLYNLDSGSLAATTATGEYDESTKTFTFDGERKDPAAAAMPFRWTLKIQDDGGIDQEILIKAGPKGFIKVVGVKYALKAKPTKRQ